MTKFIFLEVFVAVLYENFDGITQGDISDEQELFLRKSDIKNFVAAWALLNPNGEHYMKTTKFYEFLK